jgi:hypothetical protein
VKASKAADDDAKVVVHNTIKDAGEKAQELADDVEIGVSKAVSDAKIAAHRTKSELKEK